MGFAFADEVRNRAVHHEDFQSGHSARFVDAPEQVLGDDPFEGFGKRGADLVLLMGGENVDDAVDGLGRAGGVQGAKNQVARGGRREGQFDGLQIAHFAHEHDVRVFAQRAAQRRGEGAGVDSHFAMVDQGVL